MKLLIDDKELTMASFKMINGDNVIGYLETMDPDDDGFFEVYFPVSMEMNPQFGLMCKLYDPYTDDQATFIPANFVVFYGEANSRAERNYSEFMKRLNGDEDPQDEVDENMYKASKPTYMN